MKNKDDIEKARKHIQGLLKLGEEIQDSTPYLLNINQNLDWYENVCETITDKSEEIYDIIEGPIDSILNLDYSKFNLPVATGSTAMILTTIEDTTTIIQLSDSKNHYLLDDLDKINPTEKTIDNISNLLKAIDTNLYQEFTEVKLCYSQWIAGFKSNSDLAKDSRTFLEHFNGTLNKLRVPKADWGSTKFPGKSWNKMVNEIGKSGAEFKKSLLRQRSVNEEVWGRMTPILKKTDSISKEEMKILFKKYVDHIFSVINLIDDKIINQ